LKTVLSLLGTILIFGISLSADQPAISYSEYEKQLTDLQSRDQQLREQIAREQATILDVKNRIESSRKNIDDLQRKKLETLGITPADVEAAVRSLDSFIQDASVILNLPDAEFRGDSLKAAGCRARLTVLTTNPACRLKTLEKRKLSAAELTGEIEKRLRKPAAVQAITEPQTAPAAQIGVAPAGAVTATSSASSSDGSASYVVRQNGGNPETLFDIAQQVYGNAYLWPRIYQANKNNIDKNFNRFRKSQGKTRITDPSDLIYPGQVLVIPR
jgi:nucleoid-associated protein YgaU